MGSLRSSSATERVQSQPIISSIYNINRESSKPAYNTKEQQQKKKPTGGALEINKFRPPSRHAAFPDKRTSLSEVPMRRKRSGDHGRALRPKPAPSQHPRANRQHSVPQRTQPIRPASLLWRAEVLPRNAPGNHDPWAAIRGQKQGKASETWPSTGRECLSGAAPTPIVSLGIGDTK